MGIVIQFPQPRATALPPHSEPLDVGLNAAYRRDLERALSLLIDHVQSDAYDGVALILKPMSPTHKPAFVVGGFYRHRLADAAAATLQLHLVIKQRAREQRAEQQADEAQD